MSGPTWSDEVEARVMDLPSGVRARVTGFTPNFPDGMTHAPESVRLEFWLGLSNVLDQTFDPEVMRSFAEDIIAMCDLAQGQRS